MSLFFLVFLKTHLFTMVSTCGLVLYLKRGISLVKHTQQLANYEFYSRVLCQSTRAITSDDKSLFRCDNLLRLL